MGVPAGEALRGGLHRAAGPAARKVTRYLDKHPRLELLYGARYSPHDNPVERIWGALKNYVANTAVTWPGRLRQIHSFFRARSPDEMLDTAAPWTNPWLPLGYEQNFWNAALAWVSAPVVQPFGQADFEAKRRPDLQVPDPATGLIQRNLRCSVAGLYSRSTPGSSLAVVAYDHLG